MYEQFYGLTEEPFRLSPDSRFCFKHPSYKKARAYMQYALHRGEGFVMVTGQPGTGKSTLINDLTSDFSDDKVTYAKLTSTQLQANDLLRLVVLNFGLDGTTEHKALLLHNLNEYLQRLHREGRRPLLIIDEAQDLSPTALEELRLLTNLQHHNQPLLQIFLVGQEGLLNTVLSPNLKQLHQRIIAACHLDPLNKTTTAEYIKHRLTQVGWQNNPNLNPEIFPYIRQFSFGIPRLINLICSRLLLYGMVEELRDLGVEEVRSVLDGLIHEKLLPAQLENELEFLGNRSETTESSVWSQPKYSVNNPDSNEENTAPDGEESPAADSESYTSQQSASKRLDSSQFNAENESVNIQTEQKLQQRAINTIAESESSLISSQLHIPEHQKHRVEIAIKLYTQLLPLLYGKPKEKMLELFLHFMDGQQINNSVLSLPCVGLAAIGSSGFSAWLKSTNNNLDNEVREILLLVYGLMQSERLLK